MKKILFIILFFPLTLIAQSSDLNFNISDQRLLVWQKVFESDVNPSQLFSSLMAKGYFKDIEKTDSTFVGIFEGIEPDYKGYGYSEMSTPMYISRSFVNGGVIVEFKKGRYRVTLQNITFVQKYKDPLTAEGEKSKIEKYALSKSGLKSGFMKKPGEILDYTFNKVFIDSTLKNDNW